MNIVDELREIQKGFDKIISTIMHDKDETDWHTTLLDYQNLQSRLFEIDYDHLADNEIDSVRNLLNRIQTANETLIDLSRPFYKKIESELKKIKSGRKATSAYNENMD